MSELQTKEIKKLKRGELCGIIALVFCAAVCVFFAVCFPVAQATGNAALRLTALILSPVLLAAGGGVAAFCNLRFGRAIEKAIYNYVRETLIENAPLMHPERENLTYKISVEGDRAQIKVNNFKENIVIGFSAFGKLNAARRADIFSAVTGVISNTFCRLYGRGAKYDSVNYCVVKNGKAGKTAFVIADGAPDKRAYKNYLKAEREK